MVTQDLLIRMSPQAFVRLLRDGGIRRFHFVLDRGAGRLVSSHERLQPVADFLFADRRDFQNHEGMFFQVTREHETLQGAFVHCTVRGQAAGGLRYWQYDTMEEYLRDGLRLAVGMTRKNALAGLWWGGGKGVMARNPAVDRDDAEVRKSLYREYGELMTAIGGAYVTAEDVGTSVEDMAQIFATTRHTTCIPPALGGSGNPSVPTARGVIAGMEAALQYLEMGSLAGKRVAVQGMGHVGEPLMQMLGDKGVAGIVACDVDGGAVEAVVRRHRESARAQIPLEARVVGQGDESFFETECDVWSPNATGAVLNPRSIAALRARIVCGAANNQLEDAVRDDRLLHERGILYVPDFLTNRMGIVSCADEHAGRLPHDPLIERHLHKEWTHSIHRTCLKVFRRSQDSGPPPSQVAEEVADALATEPHPIFGHRGQQIIDALVAGRWFES